MVALILAIWCFAHVYKGLTGDAELYAMQAFSRIRPGLATDLFLQNTSQDQFTIFSPVYALFIRGLGLHEAALALTLTSTLWLLVAAWLLARNLSTPMAAFLGVAALLLIKGIYGGSDVFSYVEDFTTARSVAEAMVVTALVVHFTGRRAGALVIAAGALSIHPIMALPGLLLLLFLWLPIRMASMACAFGALLALAMTVIASIRPESTGILSVMDAPWAAVVRERSQFLFLPYWSLDDWEVNSRPFLYMGGYACMLGGPARRLCIASMIVGATGLAVAGIAGLVGPVPLLLQGQAWRWVWITGFAAVLLLPAALFTVWREEKCGRLCALLMVLGWICPVMYGEICAGLAWLLWQTRTGLSSRIVRCLTWAGAGLAAVVIAWIAANAWTTLSSPSADTGRYFKYVPQVGRLLELSPAAIPIVGLLILCIQGTRSRWALTAITGVLAAGTACALPMTLKNYRAGADPGQFAEWRDVIAPADVVLVLPYRNSAAFAWFTLERPSYLSVDQSAGVVFSRATALEVQRRSEVLLPLQDPDWQLLSANRLARSRGAKTPKATPALTPTALVSICGDRVLDFVVAREDVGFLPLRHQQADAWRNWNLYDCRTVRAMRRLE